MCISPVLKRWSWETLVFLVIMMTETCKCFRASEVYTWSSIEVPLPVIAGLTLIKAVEGKMNLLVKQMVC